MGRFVDLLLVAKCLAFSALIIILRGSYPRLRYDKLMMVAWK